MPPTPGSLSSRQRDRTFDYGDRTNKNVSVLITIESTYLLGPFGKKLHHNFYMAKTKILHFNHQNVSNISCHKYLSFLFWTEKSHKTKRPILKSTLWSKDLHLLVKEKITKITWNSFMVLLIWVNAKFYLLMQVLKLVFIYFYKKFTTVEHIYTHCDENWHINMYVYKDYLHVWCKKKIWFLLYIKKNKNTGCILSGFFMCLWIQ